MGSVYPRGTKLWISFKDLDGQWKKASTDFRVGQEEQATALLEAVEGRVAAGKSAGADTGPLTFGRYLPKWLESRKANVASWEKDEQRLTDHVLPVIGTMRLDAVRARHLVDLFAELRKTLAPRTVHNVYSAVSSLFADALIAGLISGTPCALGVKQLGKKVDKVKGWRGQAVYTRAEVEQLISDPRVPFDRQVFHALQALAGLRHGEAAGLSWGNYDTETEGLGMLTITTSYDTGDTKTGDMRVVPVIPPLAGMLAEWRLTGWPAMMGRAPKPVDLLAPLPKSAKGEAGRMRTPVGSLKKLHLDLNALGFRLRRQHDLRRTFISLARSDGAEKDIIRRITHKPPPDVLEGYTTFEWDVLCREAGKLRIRRANRGHVVALPVAASDLGTALVQGAATPQTSRGIKRGVGDLNAHPWASLPLSQDASRNPSEGSGSTEAGKGEPDRAGANQNCTSCTTEAPPLPCPRCKGSIPLPLPVPGEQRRYSCAGCGFSIGIIMPTRGGGAT